MLGIPIWNGLLTYKVCIANSIRWIGYFQIFTQPCYDWPETFYDFIGGMEGGPPPPPRQFKTATWVLKVFPLAPIQELYCTTFNYAGGDREQQEFCQY